MRLTATVNYLSNHYTYVITSNDKKCFVCARQPGEDEEPASAPPERMHVILDEEPVEDVWGESLVILYRQFMQAINDYLRSSRANLR